MTQAPRTGSLPPGRIILYSHGWRISSSGSGLTIVRFSWSVCPAAERHQTVTAESVNLRNEHMFRMTIYPDESLIQPTESAPPRAAARLTTSYWMLCLPMLSCLIFKSSVDRGIPSLAAAPFGPVTFPLLSTRGASMTPTQTAPGVNAGLTASNGFTPTLDSVTCDNIDISTSPVTVSINEGLSILSPASKPNSPLTLSERLTRHPPATAQPSTTPVYHH